VSVQLVLTLVGANLIRVGARDDAGNDHVSQSGDSSVDSATSTSGDEPFPGTTASAGSVPHQWVFPLRSYWLATTTNPPTTNQFEVVLVQGTIDARDGSHTPGQSRGRSG
jgi:hypothetical protein